MIHTNNSVFNTLTAKTTVNEAQLSELVKFIIKNRDIKLSPSDANELVTTKPLVSTPMNDIFARSVELNCDKLFSFVKIPQVVTSVPEVITYTHIPFDMKQLEPINKSLYDVIEGIPDFSNKIFSNITPYLKRTGELNDISSFQSLCVRDMLSRSYFINNKSIWLTPSIIRFLCRCYNMSMSIAIGGAFNLSYFEQQAIAVVFALYFFQQVTTLADAEAMIKSSSKIGLPDTNTINDIINRIYGVVDSKKAMTIDDVCLCINNLGIPRLSTVNRRLLHTRMQYIGPDLFTSTLAIEYIPAWAYIVLLAVSGRKIGLNNFLRSRNLIKDANEYAVDLCRSQAFLPSLT